MKPSSQSGMTLVEILVAVVIFTLIIGAGYTALEQGLSVGERLDEERKVWRELDSALALLERDLHRATPVAARIAGGSIPAFRGYFDAKQTPENDFISFSARSSEAFREGPASPFQRIRWRADDGKLWRSVASRLDTPYGTQSDDHIVLDGVEWIRLRYLADAGRWQRRWHAGTEEKQPLPRAAELSFKMAGYAAYKRLFHVGPTH